MEELFSLPFMLSALSVIAWLPLPGVGTSVPAPLSASGAFVPAAAVEDGVRFDNQISTGDHFRASPGPLRLLNESSSLLIAEADEYPSESHQQRYGSFRPYAIVVPRVEGILSRMLCIQNVEQ